MTIETDESKHYSDQSLLLQVAAGDKEAFTHLYNTYHHKLGAFVNQWTKSSGLGEEVVQDVFLKLWLNRTQLSEIKSFEDYLFISCRNHAYNLLKKSAAEKSRLINWQKIMHTVFAEDQNNTYDQYLPLLEEAIVHLPAQQQKVFYLKKEKGYKYKEIALALAISPETARKHLAAARKNIILYIKTHLPEVLFPLLLAFFIKNI